MAWAIGLIAVGLPDAGAAGPDTSLSQLVPAGGLRFYLEYDGLDAHADAWKATAAAGILDGTAAGTIIRDVARQSLGRILKVVPNSKLTGEDFVALLEHIAHAGFALATYEVNGKTSTVFILNNFKSKDANDRLGRLLALLFDPGATEKPPVPATPRVRGRELHDLRPPADPAGLAIPTAGATWWMEGGDRWILVRGPAPDLAAVFQNPEEATKDLAAQHKAGVNAVLDAIEGKGLNASGHAGILAARAEGRDLAGFVPSGLLIAESAQGRSLLQELRERHAVPGKVADGEPTDLDFLEYLGLGDARRVVGRWGFCGKALMTDVRFEAPGPWKGVAGMLDPAGFSRNQVPPVVRQAGAFGVGAFRAGLDRESFAKFRALVEPSLGAFVQVADLALADETNRRLLGQAIEHLGPTWCLSAVRSGNGSNDADPAVLVDVQNVDAFEKALDAAALKLNAYFREQESKDEAPKGADAARPAIAVERLAGTDRGYHLTSPAKRVPWLTEGQEPTILIGRSVVVLAPNLSLAREALAAESQPGARVEWPGKLAKVVEGLPPKLSLLSVGSPRDSSWPEAIVGLPQTAAFLVGNLVGAEAGGANADSPNLLSLLGVAPRAKAAAGNGPTKALSVSDLRALIFPSVLAATIDAHSLRIIGLEALPLGCLGAKASFEGGGDERRLRIRLKFAPGD